MLLHPFFKKRWAGSNFFIFLPIVDRSILFVLPSGLMCGIEQKPDIFLSGPFSVFILLTQNAFHVMITFKDESLLAGREFYTVHLVQSQFH